MSETAHERLPVSVLTGFLGSGKTTLLKHLLTRPELADTAVVMGVSEGTVKSTLSDARARLREMLEVS